MSITLRILVLLSILLKKMVAIFINFQIDETRAKHGSIISIYKSRDFMLESMRLCYVAYSLKFSLFRLLLQQSLHLYHFFF